jgi:hypothetical protein
MSDKEFYEEIAFIDNILNDESLDENILEGVREYRKEILDSYVPVFNSLNWQSDWCGDEVGHYDVGIVGLYSLKEYPLDIEIDVENMKVLDAWVNEEDGWDD